MIEGVNIRCTVGPFEVMRSPSIEICSKRRAVCSTASLVLPDPDGKVRAGISGGQAVKIVLSYRGESTLEQVWRGTVENVEQAGADSLWVSAIGQEKALLTTNVTESFFQEPAALVARRVLEKTGFPVADISIGQDILPHQVFASLPVWQAVKQIESTLAASFGKDMSKHALYLAEDGWHWSNTDAEGAAYRVATAENLLSHNPPPCEGAMGEIVSVLLPGLTHSRLVRIRDAVRDVVKTVRAQEVLHKLGGEGNRTVIRYGKDEGWG